MVPQDPLIFRRLALPPCQDNDFRGHKGTWLGLGISQGSTTVLRLIKSLGSFGQACFLRGRRTGPITSQNSPIRFRGNNITTQRHCAADWRCCVNECPQTLIMRVLNQPRAKARTGPHLEGCWDPHRAHAGSHRRF